MKYFTNRLFKLYGFVGWNSKSKPIPEDEFVVTHNSQTVTHNNIAVTNKGA